MRVKIFAATAALAAALTAALAGPALAADPVSLRMTVWTGNKDHLALFNDIAAEFRKANPQVQSITFDTLPFDTYTTTLTTQIAGGNPPDLAWIFENAAPDFVKSRALVPLDDTLKAAAGYRYDDLVASTLALWQEGGALYAYPFSTSPFGMFVNNGLIREAGEKTPAEMIAAGQWDWANVIRVAAAVKAKTGKAGLVVRDFDYKLWDNLSTLWAGWGAEAWSPDGKTCGFDKPEMKEALGFLHQAIFKQQALPGPGSTADFFAGEAGMTITQISRAALLKDGKIDWDLVPLPSGPKGSYAVIGQAGIGVFRNGKNPKIAAEFLAFMTNPANSAKLAQYFPPPRKNLLDVAGLAKTNPLLKPEQIEKVVIQGIATGRVKPSHTGSAEIAQLVRAGLDGMWKPDADVGAVLTAICGRIRPLLAR